MKNRRQLLMVGIAFLISVLASADVLANCEAFGDEIEALVSAKAGVEGVGSSGTRILFVERAGKAPLVIDLKTNKEIVANKFFGHFREIFVLNDGRLVARRGVYDEEGLNHYKWGIEKNKKLEIEELIRNKAGIEGIGTNGTPILFVERERQEPLVIDLKKHQEIIANKFWGHLRETFTLKDGRHVSRLVVYGEYGSDSYRWSVRLEP